MPVLNTLPDTSSRSYCRWTSPYRKEEGWLPPWVIGLTFLLIVVLYFAGLQANSIWTTHESYYAVAVREMLAAGDWLKITFNEEPRLNKPPLTYWLMAASASLFGLQEWSLRLPMVLFSIGTIACVYGLGKLLFNQWTGWLAMIMMAVSLQFVWLKHYASPEIPLAFFFTLTLYWFLRGTQTGKWKHWMGAYIACGLTVLTKGYPYYLIIGAIGVWYLLIRSQFRWSVFRYTLRKTYWFAGVPVALLIGMSWMVYAYLEYQDVFLETLQFETTQRAFSRSNQEGWLRNLFYYPEVISWSFFPFSLIFFLVFGHYLWSGKWKALPMPTVWLLVMLLVFTLAQGKLPVYILQAHPPMALVAAHGILYYTPATRWAKRLLQISLYLPFLMSLVASLAMVLLFQLSAWFYLLILLTLVVILLLRQQKFNNLKSWGVLSNGWAMGLMAWIMFTGLYPTIEQFRPYRALEKVVSQSNIAPAVPLLMEERFNHNLPYYMKRKVMRDRLYSWEDILAFQPEGPTLALVLAHHQVPQHYQVLWKGYLYKRGAESHGFLFIIRSWHALQGNLHYFTQYQLIYHPGSSLR